MADTKKFQSLLCFDLTATIPVDTSTSEAIDLAGTCLVGVILPSTFDGTAFTLTGSDSSAGTYVAIIDKAGNAVGGTSVAASKYVLLDPKDVVGFRFVKIVSTTTQTTTSTVIKLVTRPLA